MSIRNDLQEELFHEDWRDSLRHLVKALGGVEAVGADLWPTKTRKAAGNWLSDCLNPERPAKLDLEDIQALLKMGRERGVYCGLYTLCDMTGFVRPGLAAPKSPRTEILEKQAALLGEAARLQAELDRLTHSELRAIR